MHIDATTYDVNGKYLGIPGLPDTIFKISATKNDEKPTSGFPQRSFFFVKDSHYFPPNICFDHEINRLWL